MVIHTHDILYCIYEEEGHVISDVFCNYLSSVLLKEYFIQIINVKK